MHIEDWPLDRIHPYPNNPRVMHDAAQQVAQSIREFGWQQPIVVDEGGVIIIGHTRLAAARLLGLEVAPVHVARGLTTERVRALRIADNRTAEVAGWDDVKLAAELEAILAAAEVPVFTGFSSAEIEALTMQAQADLAAIMATQAAPAAAAPVAQHSAPNPAPVDAAAAAVNGPALNDQASVNAPLATSAPDAPTADLVPFNVMLPLESRAVLFDAIRRAKDAHGLAHTADAILVIARSYMRG